MEYKTMTATNTKTSVDTHTKTLIGSLALIGVVSVVSIGFTLGSSRTYAAVSSAAAKNNCDMTVADGDCDKDKVVNSQDNCILKKNKKQKDLLTLRNFYNNNIYGSDSS